MVRQSISATLLVVGFADITSREVLYDRPMLY